MTQTQSKVRVSESVPTARELVTCVQFCDVLRRQKVFPDMDEISSTAINIAADAMVSEDVRQKYLPPTGCLIEFEYLEKLGGGYYKLTGKDIGQKDFAHTEWIRLATTCDDDY